MARARSTARRAVPTVARKPFPWGTALGSLVLAVALVGLVTYAALNQGSGVRDLVRNPDAAIDGVVVADGELSKAHVTTRVNYPQTPPNGGEHNGTPQQCDVYKAPIAPEHALHSLEHGAVWITYNDSVPKDQVEQLADKIRGNRYGLMSPLPEQGSPVNLSAWGRRLSVDTVEDDRIDDFIEGYASGPTAPERGAACVGTTATGPLQAAPAQPQTAPSAAVQVPIQPSGAATAPSAAATPAG